MHAKYVPKRTKCNSPSVKPHTLPKAYCLGNLLSTLASPFITQSKQSFTSNCHSLQERGSSSEMINPHPPMTALCWCCYSVVSQLGKELPWKEWNSHSAPSTDHASGRISAVRDHTLSTPVDGLKDNSLSCSCCGRCKSSPWNGTSLVNFPLCVFILSCGM